ncbi:MAG: NADH-quinone oxidoreductase subunit A, partial [Elusimicrobia bacterium]|nr:NADH-quinone oxidoreductase subunit A [Elusimicrobiota bacterium]
MADVGIFAVVAVGFTAITLIMARLLRPRVKDACKETVYECGMPAQGTTQVRTNIRFYTFTLLFVLFDVETLYLYPWAVRAKESGVSGLIAIGIFVGVLFLGLFYAWKKGALEWE